MTTETRSLTIGGLQVSVVRKEIKNLHLGVYPPDGRIRVAAPLAVSDAAVRVAVIERMKWIRRQRAAFERQPREPEREMVSGESHYFLGQRYLLRVVEGPGRVGVSLRGRKTMELRVRPNTATARRRLILQEWYRERLRELVPPLLTQWEAVLGVETSAWGIRRMKTRWGACNAKAGRIWLNLELAKKPPRCLEYILVHELVHLIERHHNERFLALMDQHRPTWRSIRRELNATMLAKDSWGC